VYLWNCNKVFTLQDIFSLYNRICCKTITRYKLRLWRLKFFKILRKKSVAFSEKTDSHHHYEDQSDLLLQSTNRLANYNLHWLCESHETITYILCEQHADICTLCSFWYIQYCWLLGCDFLPTKQNENLGYLRKRYQVRAIKSVRMLALVFCFGAGGHCL
jgi:hypothetical protein